MSEQILGLSPAVLASAHEQSVPIFQQLTGGYPSGRDDVRAMPSVAAKRRGWGLEPPDIVTAWMARARASMKTGRCGSFRERTSWTRFRTSWLWRAAGFLAASL
jgi:hypothetical protein